MSLTYIPYIQSVKEEMKREPHMEVEIRFGRYRYKEKEYYLSYSDYYRLLNSFGRESVTRILHITTRSWKGGLREDRIVEGGKGGSEKTVYMRKKKIKVIRNEEYGYDFALSSEIPVRLPLRKEELGGTFVERIKERYQFDLGPYTLDVSKVLHEGNVRYEVELELKNPKQINLQDLNSKISFILEILSGSDIPYKQSEKIAIFNRISRSLQKPLDNYGGIPYTSFPSLQILKTEQILSGPKNISTIPLNISLKYDGERMFLFLSDGEAYLFSPPNFLNILEVKSKRFTLPLALKGTLIAEGEFFSDDPEGKTENKVLYLYDLHVFKNSLTAGTYPHRGRMEQLALLVNTVGSKTSLDEDQLEFSPSYDQLQFSSLDLRLKKFYPTASPEEVFQVSHDLLQRWRDEGEPIPIDGLVYTVNTTGTTYKWKPEEKLSIDFRFQNGQLETLKKKGEYEVLPFTQSIILNTPLNEGIWSEVDNGLPHIIEVSFVKQDDGTFYGRILRIRYDKPIPNYSYVAEDVWKDVQKPVTEKMITGGEFGFLFTYHNRIKASLYKKIENSRAETLLDVGAGRGGDVLKYPSSLSRITLIEPNSTFIQTLQERLDAHPNVKEKVHLIEKKQEEVNPNSIPPQDVVVSMLSLSYFFQSQATLEHFVALLKATVKKEGYFIFFTIDGNKVVEAFKQNNGSFVQDRLNLEQVTFRLPSYRDLVGSNLDNYSLLGHEVLVNIGTSYTVLNQVEYLADLDLLNAYLLANDFVPVTGLEDVPKEAGLNKEEAVYNYFFTWGVYRKIR